MDFGELKNAILEKLGLAADGGSASRLCIGTSQSILSTGLRYEFNGRNATSYMHHAWKKAGGKVFIDPALEANPHIVISGMSGFGKSTLLRSLLLGIRTNNVSCIVFDAHDEHSAAVRSMGGTVYDSAYSGINLLELDGATVGERISELSRLLKEVYSLGYIQTTKLSECLWYTYRKFGARGREDRELHGTPTIKDLIAELGVFIRNSKSVGERNSLLHIRARLSPLNTDSFKGTGLDSKGLASGLHSFSLARMKGRESRIIYIGELLSRLYSSMHDKEKQRGLNLYVMVDEAHFLMDDSGSGLIVTKLIEEGRKYGVGVIIVAHASSTLNRKIMTNCSTFMTFYAREPSEMAYASKVLSCGSQEAADAIRARISKLGKHEAILVSSVMRRAVVVSTPKFRELHNAMYGSGDGEILALLRARCRKPVSMSSLRMDGVDVDGKGMAAALSAGEFEVGEICTDRTDRWIMLRNPSLSLTHEVWVGYISEALSSKGIRNTIIDNATGPDIMAFHDGKAIAIEYETGSKSVRSTSKMLAERSKGYDTVIVVTGEHNLDYYSRTFGNGNILVFGEKDLDRMVGRILAAGSGVSRDPAQRH